MNGSKIVISSDLSSAKSKILSKIPSKLVRVYEFDEFKIDSAKEIIREAYIAESDTKYIVIVALSFRVEAQNALLKIIEEPPKNVVFIFIVKSKTSLLPTIRSRIALDYLEGEIDREPLGLDLRRAELKEIFEFIKSNKNVDKIRLKAIVEDLLKESAIAGITFNERELELFEKSLILANLNSRAQNILTPLLLMVNRVKKSGR
jgi:DNA polymerase-3 subunit delta'